MYSHEAFKLAMASFGEVLRSPKDLDARARMQLAAAFAGTAIENSMLGAAHSAANPLTAHYNVTHGIAVGIMLPHVIRYSAENPGARRAYAELASAPELACVSEGEDYAVEVLIKQIESLLDLADFPRSLSDCGLKEKDIGTLAEEAARQWTANFNPRALTEADFRGLYSAAMAPRETGSD
jgi:alcohol dehydrogenase